MVTPSAKDTCHPQPNFIKVRQNMSVVGYWYTEVDHSWNQFTRVKEAAVLHLCMLVKTLSAGQRTVFECCLWRHWLLLRNILVIVSVGGRDHTSYGS